MSALLALVPPLAARPAEAPAPAAASETPPATPERAELAAAVSAFERWVSGHGGVLGAVVTDIENGEVWASAGAERALNPASNAKIVTAAAALTELGPDYRFATGLYGVLEGDRVRTLVLRGNGDPSLGHEHLYRLASSLVARGLRKVDRLLVDHSYFDERFVPPAFDEQPNEWAGFRAPVSAVAIDRNTVTLVVVPGRAKQVAQAWFEPAGVVPRDRIEGAVETRAPGSGQAITLALAPGEPALSAKLGGHVAEGLPLMRFTRRLDDPRLVPGLALRQILLELDVQVPATVALGGADEKAVLALHTSEPLAALLLDVGKYSDNFAAEMVLKVLGGERRALPASSEGGAAVTRAWLERIGAWSPDARFTNGSGLFDATRISARALVAVLAHAARDPRVSAEFVSQLAIAGVDGTLQSRLRQWAPSRAIRAKTGTLAKVNALSGYVLGEAGAPRLAFSLMVNDLAGQGYEIRRRMDDVVSLAARARGLAPRR